MSNEKIIEEILSESYRLGIYNQVLELSKNLSKEYNFYDSIMIAFNRIISESPSLVV